VEPEDEEKVSISELGQEPSVVSMYMCVCEGVDTSDWSSFMLVRESIARMESGGREDKK
jgi:hypothetical protein